MKPIHRRSFLAMTAGLGLAACSTAEQEAILRGVIGSPGGAGGTAGLTAAEAAAGIREALSQGTSAAVAQVGRSGGYFSDPVIRIPLPPRLASLQSTLSRYGLSGLLDDLERQINRGAEAAAPEARGIFLDAIRSMTISDALTIVRGSETAATDYFERRTTPALTRLFTPAMERALQHTGAIQTFDRLRAQLQAVPLAPELGADAKRDLIQHGVGRGLDGLFHYVAEEERSIRRNPAKRTTAILKKVFGA
jgi:hypothetical protein